MDYKLKEFIEFCIKRLKIKNPVYVRFVLTKKYLGQINETEYGYLLDLASDLTEKESYLTIAHELAHARQYETGWLVDNSPTTILWRQKEYQFVEYDGNNWTDYINQPQEKNAERWARKLVKEFQCLSSDGF